MAINPSSWPARSITLVYSNLYCQGLEIVKKTCARGWTRISLAILAASISSTGKFLSKTKAIKSGSSFFLMQGTGL